MAREGVVPKITIYTTSLCPYCYRAKRLLTQKAVAFEEIDVSGNAKLRRELAERTGRTTVPQIWIGDRHIGGSDDLHALDRAGELDSLLYG
jgi:glutaredoxin 3